MDELLSRINPVEVSRRFGCNVARLRNEMGLTQKELAKKVGISEPTLVRIELNNVTHIDFIVAMKLSMLFKTPIIEMIGHGGPVLDLYTDLLHSSPRAHRLVRGILEADARMRAMEADGAEADPITCISFSEPIYDGLNVTRFLYNMEDLSRFKHYRWYQDAFVLLEINSNTYHPLYHMGDKLVISDRPPKNGETGIFIRENEFYLRRFVETPEKCYLEPVQRHLNKLATLVVDRNNRTDMGQYVKFGTVVAVI